MRRLRRKWPLRSSTGPSSRRSLLRGPTGSSDCSNTWSMKTWADFNPIGHRPPFNTFYFQCELFVLCPTNQVIGLLDVFSPASVLDEMQDLWVIILFPSFTKPSGCEGKLNNVCRKILSIYCFVLCQSATIVCSLSDKKMFLSLSFHFYDCSVSGYSVWQVFYGLLCE